MKTPKKEQAWGAALCIGLWSIIFVITFRRFGQETAFIVGAVLLYLSALMRYWVWKALAARHKMQHYEEPD